MLADLAHRPWRVGGHGRLLAQLHRRLHSIAAPPGLPAHLGRGEHLAHFDLHPDNVLLSARGPMVIDWSNASRGEAADDVALTWVILSTSSIPGPLPFRLLARAGRNLLIDAFLAGVDAAAASKRLATVADRRLKLDPHLLEPERRALEALIARSGQRDARGRPERCAPSRLFATRLTAWTSSHRWSSRSGHHGERE
jgi:hypothetical protein